MGDIPHAVEELIDRFGRNLEAYRSGRYNETQLRREFVDPFFGALGWDVDNRSGYAEAYKDVIHEDAIKVGGVTKAPDYCFRIGGARKFFVEAKKPAVDIAAEAGPAYQLRRYAWSAKLPLSILTDFEEFAVYDCRVRPKQGDKPAVARTIYITYDQYADRWDDIAGVFSKQAVLEGSFDKYVVSSRKRGTAEVDAEFLKEIENWRAALARNIALRNPALGTREINFAVQRTIDRIIFLRMAEDRGVETYGSLQALINGTGVYGRLMQLFRAADDRYNSGLFHFNNERARSHAPDTLTPELTIDDKPLKDIFKGLYYPVSPYEFSVLPGDILGNVYEQFLGKVIHLTAGHRARVEEKPEVKKAGGVYYTPKYIVDYIVRQTVGKLIGTTGVPPVAGKSTDKNSTGETPVVRGLTPRQISRLRILDPACGSGSFLVGAYRFLLDHHRDWYLADGPAKHTKQLYQGAGGQWYLTTDEKKKILLKNIYGVDIDSQAVEVTKLNLLLCVLENENQGTVGQLALIHQRVLPDLADNIKCGNSLIGPDFYQGQQLALFDEEARYRINAFDWPAEFPEIFARKNPGFDAVIGNPPYLNIDDAWGRGDQRQRYLKSAYSAIYNDKTDILFYFLSKAVALSRGEIGFIVSRAFLEAYKADKLRGWLSRNCRVREIVDFRNHYVFKGVGITTAIIRLGKSSPAGPAKVYRLRAHSFQPGNIAQQKEDAKLFEGVPVGRPAFGSEPWTFVAGRMERLNSKVDELGCPLGQVLVVGQGMQTGRNSVFGSLSREHVRKWGLQERQCYLRARNSDILRHHIRDRGEILLYLEDEKSFELLPDGVRGHLKAHEVDLRARAAFKRGDCKWWRYTWPLHKERVRSARLYCPYLATRNRFALDAQGRFLGLTDTTVLYDADQPEDLRYILGLLNSSLLTLRFRSIGKLKSGGILEYFWNSICKLPIRRVDFSKSCDRAAHDRLVNLVDQMMNLHTEAPAAKTEHDKTALGRQIAATDREIDRLVYELYALTEEEISIVEQCTRTSPRGPRTSRA